MIKTKLKTIINSREAMQRLAGQTLPVAVSYRIAKLIKLLNDELALYESERIKLCERYGELNPEENKYNITQGAEFTHELNSLLDYTVELAADKISLPSTLTITPSDLISMDDFVEIEGVNDD